MNLSKILEDHKLWIENPSTGARADLSGADLSGADLSRANLFGADLSRADLSRANLSGADLSGAVGVIDGGSPNGFRCFGWLKGGRLNIRAGCRNKRPDEGRAYWADKPNRAEILAAIDYIEAVARLRGWSI